MAISGLREQLQRDEGLRLTAYEDSEGVLTIGYGFNLSHPLPRSIAEALLDYKIAEAVADVKRVMPWTNELDDARRGALYNLAYNMGVGGLLGFHKMLSALGAGDFEKAAEELLDSKYAEQVGPRAERLAEQIKTGAWR